MKKNVIKSRITGELFYMLHLLFNPGYNSDSIRYLRNSIHLIELDLLELENLNNRGDSND